MTPTVRRILSINPQDSLHHTVGRSCVAAHHTDPIFSIAQYTCFAVMWRKLSAQQKGIRSFEQLSQIPGHSVSCFSLL